MVHIHKNFILSLCFISTGCSYSPAAYADNGSVTPVITSESASEKVSGAGTDSLHLIASVKNDGAEVGNMILLQVALVNTSANEVGLINQGDPDDEFVIVVEDKEGKEVPLSMWGKSLFKYKPDYFPTAMCWESVPAKGKKTYQFSLNRIFDLSFSGIYTVAVSRAISLAPGKYIHVLKSEKVSFRVNEPPVDFIDPDSFQLQ